MSGSQGNANANISSPEAIDLSAAWGSGWGYWNADDRDRREIVASNLAPEDMTMQELTAAPATLQRDEWENLSSRMVEVYEQRLVGISDLRSAGVTRNISLATQIDLWETVSEMTPAEVSMDGETRSEEDRPIYDVDGVPVPIIHKDFRIRNRELQSSRRLGNDLRTDSVSGATTQVTEMNERLLFKGWGPSVGTQRNESYSLYGYTSWPGRETIVGNDWSLDGPGGTGVGNIRDTFVAILDRMDANERLGPYTIYVAPEQWREYRSTVDAQGDGSETVRERIESELDSELRAVRRAPMLDAGEAVGVELNTEVVELAQAEDVQLVNWQSGSGMTNHYKVLSALAPEFKQTAAGQVGICHVTGI